MHYNNACTHIMKAWPLSFNQTDIQSDRICLSACWQHQISPGAVCALDFRR